MKKKIFIITTIMCLSISTMFGQSSLENSAGTYTTLAQEKIFVHFNSTFLVSGESLYYKIYCLNSNTNNLSKISKVAYIELINTDRNTVFKHKITLKSGLGQGDFFIKTAIPSGNYKLIAYTQWMRNQGETAFFKNDITIINPFRVNKKLSVKIAKQQDTLINSNHTVKTERLLDTNNKNEFLRLKTNIQTFSKREKVELTINGLKQSSSYGNYSISIRKIDPINTPNRNNSSSFSTQKHLNTTLKDSVLFLPELRGELLTGKVYFKETNTPKPNIKVGFSIPGKEYIFKIVTTNKSGVFYLNLENAYDNPNAFVQIIDEKRDDYRIEFDNYKSPNYSNLTFNDFTLTPQLNDLILEKSISNQIENAYHVIKNDSIIPLKSKSSFYKSKEVKYFLKDYTRFKTLKETTEEVIDAVYFVRKNDKHTFHIKFYNEKIKSDLLPLILMDGILIQNHDDIIYYNAKDIKSIEIVRNKYIYGKQLYAGIISIETIKKDYKPSFKERSAITLELDKPQIEKKYFKQTYEDDISLNRIPDFRSQLLWDPNFKFNTNEARISFYTSDSPGTYEIYLEGFTNEGKPVSIRDYIKVID